MHRTIQRPRLCYLWASFALLDPLCALASGTGHHDDGTVSSAFAIFQHDCLKCHSAEKRKGDFEMTSRESLIKGGETGPAIDPGNSSKSYLIELLFPGADPHMPPKSQLDPEEIRSLEEWVDAGAPWDGPLWERMRTSRHREAVQLGELPDGFAPTLAVVLSPDATRLAAGRGSVVEIFDVSNDGEPGQKAPLQVLAGHRDIIQSLAWSADGKRLASGGFRKVLVWETQGFTLESERTADLAGRITALEFSPEGTTLAVADSVPSAASLIHWWEVGGDSLESVAGAHEDTIFDIEIGGDGKLLASAGADKMVHLWDVKSRKLVRTLEGHTSYVLGLAFGPESDRIATSGDDGSVKVWVLDSGKRVGSFEEDPQVTGPVAAVAWIVNDANVKRKANEKNAEKAAEINTDQIFAVTESGRPVVFTDLVEHEGAERSDGARARVLTDAGEILTSIALDRKTGRFFAGSIDGTIFQWDAAGKLEIIRRGGDK